ncbi:MAG: AAA-like domain-containing protein [Prevotellaceae bacterium]|nr:AAA-like domain-containing protein [Prevotellaceae bacterium]
MINASTRLQGVEQLIDMRQYFVIHAARQSGKTTYLKDLTTRLNADGKYYTLYCTLEGMQGITDPEKGIPEVVRKIQNVLRFSDIPQKAEFAKEANYANFTSVLNMELTLFCMTLDKPLVILFDEADCLSENTLISFLRQLREGYNNRSATTPFVHSVALVGMRNIRDYKAKVRPESQSLGSASPFNIVSKTYTLQNFSRDEIAQLYRQHTDEMGQEFKEDAIALVWEQTQGQPWLVNAIANQVIVEMLQSDYAKPVTAELVKEAIQTIILRRDTHIDSLLERLKEERVRKVIEPIISGNDFYEWLSDDFSYVKDLGLITEIRGRLIPSNPIYGEVIARTLSHGTQQLLLQNPNTHSLPRYLNTGRIDMDCLMRDFQQFWRENSDIWVEKYEYKEAAPHLILMAFLQRVINGGGQLIREMAAGTGRLDLCLIYENLRYPIELKIRHGEKYLENGLAQTAHYMDIHGCTEGWLALFDRRPNIPWEEKIYMEKKPVNGKTVTIVGL